MECPACKHENLPGEDYCQKCSTPLTETQVRFILEEGGDQHRIHDRIRKVRVQSLVAASPETPVLEVVRQMKKHRVGGALVVEDNQVVGIFTRRDALHRLAKPGLDLNQLKIGNFMTPSPEVLTETDTIACALNKMAMGSKRHVPVRKPDGTVFVFSVRDVLHYFF